VRENTTPDISGKESARRLSVCLVEAGKIENEAQEQEDSITLSLNTRKPPSDIPIIGAGGLSISAKEIAGGGWPLEQALCTCGFLLSISFHFSFLSVTVFLLGQVLGPNS
jgi:hypothetical protein